MHRAMLAVGLALATASFLACVSEEPVRPATALPAPPTVARPPLVSPTVSPSPSPSPFAEGRTYTVQSGDTLTSIADRFYNDAGQWRAIYDANRDQLTSADSLRVGMTIRIPQLSR